METVKKILIEFVSVVFAVLLALGLNHWRETNNEKKLAEKALKNIIIEVKDNIRTLEEDKDDYLKRIDELDSVKVLMEAGKIDDFEFGYNCPILNNAAWKVANSTGAVKDMDLEIVMTLSELYIFQETFQDNGFSFFKVVSSPEFQEKDKRLGALNALTTQLTISHQFSLGLKEGFETFLTEYKDRLPEISETEEKELLTR